MAWDTLGENFVRANNVTTAADWGPVNERRVKVKKITIEFGGAGSVTLARGNTAGSENTFYTEAAVNQTVVLDYDNGQWMNNLIISAIADAEVTVEIA